MSSYGEMLASQIASAVPTAVLMQDAATANGAGSSLDASGYATTMLSITTAVAMGGGTTINFEASVDGSTWTPILGTKVGTTSSGTTTQEPGDWVFSIAGYKYVRARISDYSAGEITIQGFATVFTVAGISSGSGSGGDTQLPETYTVPATAASPVATIFEMSGSSSKVIRINDQICQDLP